MTKEIIHNYLIDIKLLNSSDNLRILGFYFDDNIIHIEYEWVINGYIASDFYTISNRLLHRYIISQRKEKLKIINKL